MRVNGVSCEHMVGKQWSDMVYCEFTDHVCELEIRSGCENLEVIQGEEKDEKVGV